MTEEKLSDAGSREAEIPLELRRINEGLEVMAKEIQSLKAKISPVLRPPVPKEKLGMDRGELNAPLAMDIRAIGDVVHDLVDIIEETALQVEL